MSKHCTTGESAEVLILPDGRVLAHNITPEMAAVLTQLEPRNELIQRRLVRTSEPVPKHGTAAGR